MKSFALNSGPRGDSSFVYVCILGSEMDTDTACITGKISFYLLFIFNPCLPLAFLPIPNFRSNNQVKIPKVTMILHPFCLCHFLSLLMEARLGENLQELVTVLSAIGQRPLKRFFKNPSIWKVNTSLFSRAILAKMPKLFWHFWRQIINLGGLCVKSTEKSLYGWDPGGKWICFPDLIIFHTSDQYSQPYILHPEVFMYAAVCHNNNLLLSSTHSLLNDLHLLSIFGNQQKSKFCAIDFIIGNASILGAYGPPTQLHPIVQGFWQDKPEAGSPDI